MNLVILQRFPGLESLVYILKYIAIIPGTGIRDTYSLDNYYSIIFGISSWY